MSGFSELALRLRDDDVSNDLTDIASMLDGEVDGRMIRCASPGRSHSDRSCHVRIDPSRPGDFFVYDCEGSKSAAYAAIRERLSQHGLSLLTARIPTDAIERILRETVSASGTLVERYLRSRAITLPLPPSLRFHPALFHKVSNARWPAMVAVRTGTDGEPVAIHRTYLRRDGSGKAPIEPQRMDLGPTRSSSIRLSPVADQLIIGEGIETTLSAMQACGLPGWAAGSAIALRRFMLPNEVRSLIIVADGDDAGRAAARAAATAWMDEGRHVRIAQSPQGTDFNDLLMGKSSA
jgi:hypothetical protein